MFITQGKTNVKYLFILAIITAIAGGVMLFMEEIMKCPYWWPSSQQITIVKDQTADWKTYSNEGYGFEVKYPKDYFLEDIPSWNGEPTGSLLLRKIGGVETDWLIEIYHDWINSEEDKSLSFEESAEKYIILNCAADGVYSSRYCSEVVKKEPFTTDQNIKGYRFYITEVSEAYKESGTEISKRTKGPIFALDVSQYTNLFRGMFFSLTELGEKNAEDNLKILNQMLSPLPSFAKATDGQGFIK